MKKLEDYVSVLTLVLGSATGCNWSVLNPPKIEPNHYPEVYCYNLYEENSTICEYDVNRDGNAERVEKRILDRDNNLSKRLTDYGDDGIYEKEESFVYGDGKSLIKYIIKESNKTSIREYAGGKIKRDLYDADSDGNFETIFIYNEDGTITYLGDENDDGRLDIRSEDVNVDHAGCFDPDGKDGITYQRILKLSKDLDSNGK